MREMGTVPCHRLVEFVTENENVRTKESCPERLAAAVPPDVCATSPRVFVRGCSREALRTAPAGYPTLRRAGAII